jgi:PAS domain S-box-containing protein
MSYDIKVFQKRYILSNKEIADICKCSLPTIQKWRSGEVRVSGAASQLLTMLDISAEGDPNRLRGALLRLNQEVGDGMAVRDADLDELESSMNHVVDRLELMLESRRKEKELAASEARYRSMLQSYSIPACRWLPDTTLTFVNDAYAELYKDFGPNLVGKRWIDLLPAERRKAAVAIVSDMVRRGEEESSIYPFPFEGGPLRHFEWRDVPVKNERGEVLEFHSIAHDVTELMTLRSEVELFHASKNALLGLSDHPVLIFDGAGEFVEMNEVFRSDFLQDQDCTSLWGLIKGEPSTKLNRLLRRATRKDEICFRVLVDKTIHLMKIRLLSTGINETRFLAVFQPLRHVGDSPVLHVRFQHEVILEGEKREFLMDDSIAGEIRHSMEAMGQTIQGDRIYVFIFNKEDDVFDNVLEWCADGVKPHIEDLQGIPMSIYPWWMKRMQKHQWIIIEDTAKLPRGANKEREILLAQGIGSVLAAPLIVGDEDVGFVGVDNDHSPRIWHDQEKKEMESFKQRIEHVLQEMLRTGEGS